MVTSPSGTLQIDTTTPTLSSISETPANGHLKAGKTIALTLTMSEAVTVAGGVPTLTLNDGAIATYTGGSGTNALTLQLYGRGRAERKFAGFSDRNQSERRDSEERCWHRRQLHNAF